jgi:hypothetical protein
MLVKSTHFIPNVPGAPVYELMDGTIMLPFVQKNGGFLYYSEDQVRKNCAKKDLATALAPFEAARKQINSVRDAIMKNIPAQA